MLPKSRASFLLAEARVARLLAREDRRGSVT